jgi:hypothetical protein
MKALLSTLGLALALGGCATMQPVGPDISAFNQAAPRSILIVPPINHSLDVDAPTYMLSTLAIPLAEKGFYVFPVNTTKVILEHEGFYEGDQIQQQPTQDLAKLFGADAVLYVTINRWDAQYLVLQTTVTVDFDYRIVNHDGTELWKAHQAMTYQPQQSSSGNAIAALVAAAVSAAVTRAKPDDMPLVRQANTAAIVTGPNAIPDGPYKKTTNK